MKYIDIRVIMKPFHTLLAIFLFYLFSLNLNAQYSPIILDDRYDFNLPQMEVTFSLPARSGYVAPLRFENESFMDIEDDRVNYFFNPERLSQSDFFHFYMPGGYSPCMNMFIAEKKITNVEKRINSLKSSFGTKQEIPAIMSKAGSWTGVQLLLGKDQPTVSLYYFQNEEYYFEFSYPDDNPEEKEACENIIKSFNKRNTPNEICKYEARIKERMLELEEEKKELEDDREKFTGVTLDESIYLFPELGLTFRASLDLSYTFKGRNMVVASDQEDTISVDISTDDACKDLELHFDHYHFYGKNSVDIRFRKNMKSPIEMLEDDASRQHLISKFPLVIDGMNAFAGSFGTEESQTINIYLPLKEYGLSLMIRVSNEDDLIIMDRFLAGIKISPDQKLPTTPPAASKLLSQQIKVKRQDTNTLPELPIPPFNPDNFPVITHCYFTETGTLHVFRLAHIMS